MALPGQDSLTDGYAMGLDDGTTGAEVVHKATWGFVAVVNVTVNANALVAGATLEIRNGTGAGNDVWIMNIPALAAAGGQVAFPVILNAIFATDIRTIITAGAGTMSVSYV